MLNQDGHVSEGSAANFAIIRDGVLITSPVESNILEGITRRSILHLAQAELGLPVVERHMDRSEVYLADEAFFCGTGAQVAPVTSVDHRAIGNGEVGPVVKQLQELFFGIVRGKNEKYMDWLTPVPRAEKVPG